MMEEKPDKEILYRAFYLPVETCFYPLYNFSKSFMTGSSSSIDEN